MMRINSRTGWGILASFMGGAITIGAFLVLNFVSEAELDRTISHMVRKAEFMTHVQEFYDLKHSVDAIRSDNLERELYELQKEICAMPEDDRRESRAYRRYREVYETLCEARRLYWICQQPETALCE